MNQEEIKATKAFCDAMKWSKEQWGKAELGDLRLQDRAVEIGAHMAMFPGTSLPQQMQDWAQLKATYRLLSNAKVTHEALSENHWQATREKAAGKPVVLMLQDITELSYTHYKKTMKELGPIGNGKGCGVLLHTTLAVEPSSQAILGIAHQKAFKRVPLPEGKTHKQIPKSQRESRIWRQAVRAIGRVPDGTRWVSIADRGSDCMQYMLACRAQRMDFNIRLAQNRRLVTQDDSVQYLFPTVRSWPAVVGKTLHIPATHGNKARTAHILLSFGKAKLRISQKNDFLSVWIVRAWEVNAPADVQNPVEWIVATSVEVTCAEQALQRIAWYTSRWLIEDYHQCLKTGCAIEKHDLEHLDRITRLLGFLALIAVRLLQLRQLSRLNPELPASTVAEPLLISLIAKKYKIPSNMTVKDFWRGVAKLGGFLGRRSDGQPGWKTLWKGWLYLSNLVEGAALISSP